MEKKFEFTGFVNEKKKDELFKNATSELEKFYTYINMLDLKRNVNISESLSEWAKYFIK